MADDWWDRLYSPDDDQEPASVAGGGRLPDWRTGQTIDLDKPTTDTDPQAEDPDPNDDETHEADDQPKHDRDSIPPWDPTAITERLLRAHHTQPIHQRIQDAAHQAWRSKPSLGQATYTLTGIWAAWHYGLTPWLIQATADAPIGVSIALVAIGWSIHRQAATTALPLAWCGHTAYTTTVIAAALHP